MHRIIMDRNNRSNAYHHDEGYAETYNQKLKDSEQPLMAPLPGKTPNAESSAVESGLSMTLPVLERKCSSVQNHEKTSRRRGFDGDRSFRDENHYNNHHPSYLQRAPQYRIDNFREWQHSREEGRCDPNMLKKPPPSYDTPLPKGSNSSRHNLASPSMQTKRYQEANCDRLSFDKKPPPLTSSSPFLSKTKHQASPSQRFRAQYSRSAVPQAIDVDLSFKTFHYDENDTSHLPAPPPLSPISFSSSTLYKKSYYPSKESIEKQLSSLPPIEPLIRKEPPSNTIGTTKRKTPTVLEVSKGVTTATATEKPSSTNIRRANTAQPTSEESSMAASQHRPEKPLRINSQFPSQLQLQKRRQLQQEKQQKQQQQKQRQQQQTLYLQDYPTMQMSRSKPMISRNIIPSPQPLPKGNGVTNDVATRIKASRQHESAFPLDHNQEYGLQLSFHSSTREGPSEQPSPQPLPRGNGVTNGVATRIDASRQRPITFVPQAHNQDYDLRNFSLPTRNAETTTPEQSSISSPQDQPENNVRNSAGISLDSMITRRGQTYVEVEIYPGVSKVLRGARETSLACDRNFVVDCTCLVCTHQSSCIADAEFFICPSCMVVNPLHEGTIVSNYKSNGFLHKVKRRWGVGLGYIPESKPQ